MEYVCKRILWSYGGNEMAKNAFFSDELMQNVEQLVTTEHGKTLVDYGKGNFVLGASVAVAFGAAGYLVYEAGKLAVQVVRYLKS
jgi:hypothetical protein